MNPDFCGVRLVRCCRVGGVVGCGGRVGRVLRECFGRVLVGFGGGVPVWVGRSVVVEFLWV